MTQEVIETALCDIYERDAHFRLINDVVQTHAVTGGELRSHILLYGRPGGAKTTILERLKPLYDDEQFERMKFLDASSMSKAGFERWVMDQAESGLLPEILVLEEIEKVDNKDNLKSLGSLMASGYIQRTNCGQAGYSKKVSAKFLVIATCNDEAALEEFRKGYLWDRFTERLHCPLPSREMMFRILLDKISRIPGGHGAWAAHAMKLADSMGVTTPRQIIGFLAGRDRLMDGSYQADRMAIDVSAREEEVRLAK